MLKELYEKKLKYNCSYYEMKSEIYNDLLIVFLGTSDFIIIDNFLGVAALGCRNFDFDKNKAIYTYKVMVDSVHISRLEKIMRTYESKRLKINNVEFKREGAEL